VGVDVEQVRPLPDLLAIAARFFAPVEAQQLLAIDDPVAQARAFFSGWTRKEAFIKAVGSGLQHPLDSFAVTLLPHEPPGLVALPGWPDLCAGWTLHAWEPAPGYCAAVVAQGEAPAYAMHDFDAALLATL
jgi:4'-phosphopantetheinyl transferase